MKYLLAFLTTISISSYGQKSCVNTYSSIDKSDLKRFVKVLTSDTLQGRQTGSVGQKRAARFISERFEQLGLHAGTLDGYHQKFELIETSWGEVYIKKNGKKLENFENMIFMGHTPQNTEIEREVIFGGNGSDHQLNQIEVEDRIVLIFTENLRASYEIRQRLKSKNAYAVILTNPDNDKQFESIKNTFHDYILNKRLTRANTDTIKDVISPLVNEFVITNTQIKNIMGVSVKSLKSSILKDNIAEFPIPKVQLKCERVIQVIETENVIGILKGHSANSIIVSGHYDHLGQNETGYFPGADDNASGVAGLLELAERFSVSTTLSHNIIFLATTAEEEGLLGSLHYVNQSDFNSSNVLCNLNLDMIGRSDGIQKRNKSYLYCIGTDLFENLDSVVRAADDLYNNCKIDYTYNNSKSIDSFFFRSDQYSFYRKGIPSIMFFGGLHDDYHKISDTAKKIDFELLENRVRLISKVIDLLQEIPH